MLRIHKFIYLSVCMLVSVFLHFVEFERESMIKLIKLDLTQPPQNLCKHVISELEPLHTVSKSPFSQSDPQF